MVHGRKEAHENRRKTFAPFPFRASHCSAICWLPRTEPETREPEGLPVDLLLDIILWFATDKDDPPAVPPAGQPEAGGRHA
jgi:hypothetical protein